MTTPKCDCYAMSGQPHFHDCPTQEAESCPSCGYIKRDQEFHGDHHLCKNAGNAPWEKQPAVPSDSVALEVARKIDVLYVAWYNGTNPTGEWPDIKPVAALIQSAMNERVFCTRGAHAIRDICPDAFGVPCSPPADEPIAAESEAPEIARLNSCREELKLELLEATRVVAGLREEIKFADEARLHYVVVNKRLESELTDLREQTAEQEIQINEWEGAIGQGFHPATEARWQKEIYELCKKAVGPGNDHLIDGGGCDSGDAIDFTLTEIKQAIGFWRDEADAMNERERELATALNNLKCEIVGWVGLARPMLVEELSITNVRVMEHHIIEAERLLSERGEGR